MSYVDPNAPHQTPTPAAVSRPPSKSGAWSWVWSSIGIVVAIKLFGVLGGLVAFGSYFWLKPKLGAWLAIFASAVLGFAAIGILILLFHR